MQFRNGKKINERMTADQVNCVISSLSGLEE